MKALYFKRFGGPDVLEYGDLRQPLPPVEGAVVRLNAIGLNFADVYRRRGNYHLDGSPPYVAGYEGAGIVEATGTGAPQWLRPGLRVALADSPFANADFGAAEASRLIALAADLDDATPAAL